MTIITNELCLLGTRYITINNAGKQEVQTTSCYVVSFDETTNQQIINSNDPYNEYCKQLRAKYSYNIPIFIWDLEENENDPLMIEREKAYFMPDSIYTYENPNPEDIVSYKRNLAERLIEDTDKDIQQLLNDSYTLKWIIK